MHTSNHSSKRAYRPYRLTRAGSRLATYLDYCENRPADSNIQFGDVQWDIAAGPKNHIQTPEETAWMIQELTAAGCTFPNFQTPPEHYDDDREQPAADDDDDDFYEDENDPYFDLDDLDDDDYGSHSPEED